MRFVTRIFFAVLTSVLALVASDSADKTFMQLGIALKMYLNFRLSNFESNFQNPAKSWTILN